MTNVVDGIRVGKMMLSSKYVRICNYKAILLTLLSFLGLLEIMNKYETERTDLTPNEATDIEGSFLNLSEPKKNQNKKDDISNSAKAKILLLAYARSLSDPFSSFNSFHF